MTNPREALEEAWNKLHDHQKAPWQKLAVGNGMERFRRFLDAEAYTDAALMLVPEGAKWAVTSRNSACCSMDHVAPLDWVYSTHPALAIAQAALNGTKNGRS